jgi:hypothetical protein
MQDSNELIKLLLPEIIVEYFELTSYKRRWTPPPLLKVNSIPKEYRQSKLSSKGSLNEITVQDFPIRGHQVYLHYAEGGSMKILGKSYLEIGI